MKLSLGFVLKKTFWDLYDHLGILIVINVLTCIFSFFLLPIPFALLSLFYVTRKISKGQEVRIVDFFQGLGLFKVQSLKLGGLILVFFILPLVNIFFTTNYLHSVLGAMFFALSVIILLLSLLLSIYFLPLLAAGNGFKQAFAVSLSFCKNNSLFTLGVMFQLLMLKIIFLVSGVGIILILGSLCSLLMNNAFLNVLSVYKNEALIDYSIYENRSLREIFLFWQHN